ncbi:MAG: DUF192 domain-containing protein [Patescibacteria group bacterium]
MENKRKKLYKIFIVGICISLVIVVFALWKNTKKIRSVEINNHEISVEVMDTPHKRQQGLSGREELCENCGMLFVFDEVGEYSFWMKDMLFDIDIVWIRGGSVVSVLSDVSSKTPTVSLMPPESVDRVLELPAGQVEKIGIIQGTGVQYIK